MSRALPLLVFGALIGFSAVAPAQSPNPGSETKASAKHDPCAAGDPGRSAAANGKMSVASQDARAGAPHSGSSSAGGATRSSSAASGASQSGPQDAHDSGAKNANGC